MVSKWNYSTYTTNKTFDIWIEMLAEKKVLWVVACKTLSPEVLYKQAKVALDSFSITTETSNEWL